MNYGTIYVKPDLDLAHLQRRFNVIPSWSEFYEMPCVNFLVSKMLYQSYVTRSTKIESKYKVHSSE